MVRAFHHDIGAMRDLCLAAFDGVWSLPEPETFSLGPDHWIRIDAKGIVISVNGVEKVVKVFEYTD